MKITRSGAARTRPAAILALMLGATVACGCSDEVEAQTKSGAESSAGATSGAGGSGGASTPGPTSSGATGGGEPGKILEMGPPECYSPSGYQLCGGPNQCPYDKSFCEECFAPSEDWKTKGTLTTCMNDAILDYYEAQSERNRRCGNCVDGTVCIDYSNTGEFYFCSPFEFGELYAQNGGADRVRYADFSAWTGEPIPNPVDCPSIPGVPLCGGACGDCPEPYFCTGRSPLHPYGICISEWNTYIRCAVASDCAPSDDGCFQWKEQPEVQGKPNDPGHCIPPAICKSLAANLPGGGSCDAP